MSNAWRVIRYGDPLTEQITAIEIVPEDDVFTHTHNEACHCLPELTENENGIPVLTHNSFDGREAAEISR